MSENNLPSAKPDPEVSPGEFDFATPLQENPRMKRRSLKPAQAAPVSTSAHEKAGGNEIPAEKITKPAPTRPAAAATTPAPSAPNSAATRPKSTASTQPTSPHGTRPATLYYSSGSRQDKETPSTMKSTPAASPSPSTPTSTPSAARTTPASTRPASVVDYRTNVDRQAREQKSVGGILSILVYTLIVLFVVGAGLAGYGAYVVHQALNNQSATVAQLEARYDAENKDLNTKLATTLDTLTQAQAQIGREQDLIVKQQETINKLLAATQDNASALRQEKEARTDEAANLRARIRNLEYRGPTTQKY